jgi:hypothetical protein
MPNCHGGCCLGSCSRALSKSFMKSKSSLLAASCLFAIGTANAVAATALVAGFDFQTTTNGGTAASAAPSAPLAYNSNFGTATLYLDGTNGSNAFTSLSSNPQVTGFGGSSVNTVGTSFSTVTSGTSSLVIANSTANGKRAVFKLLMTDFEDLVVTYSTQATSSGFNDQTWSYSTDGVNFTTFTSFNPRPLGTATSFSTVGVVSIDFSTIAALEGAANVYLGLTLSGATSASGNNRLDNFQFNAVAVPEPQSAALLGALGLPRILRHRRK